MWPAKVITAHCTFLTGQVSQQRDGLDGFAEAHLICQDAVKLLLIHGDQPVQSNVLVLTQCAVQQEGNRRFHLKRKHLSVTQLIY